MNLLAPRGHITYAKSIALTIARYEWQCPKEICQWYKEVWVTGQAGRCQGLDFGIVEQNIRDNKRFMDTGDVEGLVGAAIMADSSALLEMAIREAVGKPLSPNDEFRPDTDMSIDCALAQKWLAEHRPFASAVGSSIESSSSSASASSSASTSSSSATLFNVARSLTTKKAITMPTFKELNEQGLRTYEKWAKGGFQAMQKKMDTVDGKNEEKEGEEFEEGEDEEDEEDTGHVNEGDAEEDLIEALFPS